MKSSEIQGGIKFNQCKYNASTHTVSFDVLIKGFDNYKPGKYYFCSYVWDGENYCFGDVKEFEVASNSLGLCPDNHHPHAIDLGLPSGTKWACCNVGATTPEGYGGYYAWGETEEKSTYSTSTYKYYSNGSYINIGEDIAGTEYDVAHVKWGGSWVMPSDDQISELRINCSWKWVTQNGVNGRQFTGPSGGAIFLPAAGSRSSRWNDGLGDAGSVGYYWSSTQAPSYSNWGGAYGLYFDWRSTSQYLNYYHGRYDGQSVRPVSR